MCQGLPCLGARVRLNKQLLHEGVEFAAGTDGIVVREHPDTREIEVQVNLRGDKYSIKVDENDVDVIER